MTSLLRLEHKLLHFAHALEGHTRAAQTRRMWPSAPDEAAMQTMLSFDALPCTSTGSTRFQPVRRTKRSADHACRAKAAAGGEKGGELREHGMRARESAKEAPDRERERGMEGGGGRERDGKGRKGGWKGVGRGRG